MPKKILLADDSITIQKVVELTFSDGDYEVTAVNNGARAIQKLAEMRPDIILSDIIMPEKNGYEVCEYVKSHPEYRNIPVVLLTGTFEPFDPDRADKAGCDAVVTKPFESQSLIHKVEELIEQARANAPASAPAPAPAPAVTAPTPAPAPPPPAAAAPESSPWSDDVPAAPAPPSAADIFSSPSRPSGPTTEMPFGQSSPATTQQFTPPAAPEDSPWGAPPMGGETRAFPKMSFDDMKRMAEEKPPEPAQTDHDDSPFGAPPDAEQFSGETRAFPKMNFADLEKAPEPPAPVPQPEESEGPAWSMTSEPPAAEEEESPATSFEAVSEAAETQAEEPAWALSASSPAPAAASSGNGTLDLSEEQIDRIARRVVQLMSDQVIRNIAWEVIPDTAEMIVKERIRQLESES